MPESNQIVVPSFPYSHSGVVSNGDLAQYNLDWNFHGYAEEQFLLSTTPGETLTIVYRTDTNPANFVVFENPITYTRYFEYGLSASSSNVMSPGAFNGTAVSHSEISSGLTGLPIELSVVWTVPGGVTTAILAVCTGPTNYTWPDGYTEYRASSNYSISITSDATPVVGSQFEEIAQSLFISTRAGGRSSNQVY